MLEPDKIIKDYGHWLSNQIDWLKTISSIRTKKQKEKNYDDDYRDHSIYIDIDLISMSFDGNGYIFSSFCFASTKR